MSSDDVWVENNVGRSPRLLAAIPCEDGAVSFAMNDTRVTLQRIFYEVYAAEFPAVFERLNIATIWMGGDGDYTVGVRLSAPNGTVISEVTVGYESRPEPATVIHLFHFSNDGGVLLTLPEAGRYAVDVLLDDVPIWSFPFFAVAVPTGGRPEMETEIVAVGEEVSDG